MPIPQELFFLVGWASCPSHQLRKRIFARGLIKFIRVSVSTSVLFPYLSSTFTVADIPGAIRDS